MAERDVRKQPDDSGRSWAATPFQPAAATGFPFAETQSMASRRPPGCDGFCFGASRSVGCSYRRMDELWRCAWRPPPGGPLAGRRSSTWRPVAALAGPLSSGRPADVGSGLRRPAGRSFYGRSCHGRLRTRSRRPRARRRWRRPEPRRSPVVPARLTRVPRSPAIVGTPVRSHRKRDHRSPASNRSREIPRVDPAAPPAGDNVAPAPAAGAPNHVDGRSWPEPGDQRKRAVGTGAHVDRLRGERGLREGGDRHQQR